MPPGPAMADQAPPRSPHRSNGGVTPQSPLRIRQDGKFYERLLTKDKETSAAGNLSFRYYWAEPGAVPFVWESQPGTPKDVARMAAAAGALLPAITPPPSYLFRHGCRPQAPRHGHQKSGNTSKQKRRCRLKRVRIGFIAGIFRRLSLGKAWRPRRTTTTPVIKVSSSSRRWLFSSVATDAGDHNLHHQDEIAVVAAAHAKTHKAVPCSFPATPWLLRFCTSSGNQGGGGTHGWA